MNTQHENLTGDQIYIWRTAYKVQDKKRRSPRISEIVEESGFSLGKVREAIAALKAAEVASSEEGRLGTLTFQKPPAGKVNAK